MTIGSSPPSLGVSSIDLRRGTQLLRRPFVAGNMGFSLTSLAMLLAPAAIVGRANPKHLQLVPPSPPSVQPPMASGTATDPVVSLIVVTPRASAIDRDTAMKEFMAAMIDCGAGGALAFRHVARNYAQLGATAGWPPLKDKALSLALARHGCTKHVGPRQKDGSRPTIVTFPKTQRRRLSA